LMICAIGGIQSMGAYMAKPRSQAQPSMIQERLNPPAPFLDSVPRDSDPEVDACM
jgi:hypothetical protein